MKKIILFSAIALLCASMVFAFSKKDLAGLKGTWEGTGSGGGGGTLPVKIEIMNDTEPLQGKLTVSKIPQGMQSEYGLPETVVGESSDGKLTSKGTIMFTGANGFFEIQSLKDNKLKGWGYFKGFKADITATKK